MAADLEVFHHVPEVLVNAPSQDPLRTGPYIPEPNDTIDSSPTTGPDPKGQAANLPSIPGYAILGEIARGGMGVVYAANDLALDREVAIKMVLGSDHDGTTQRFVRESKITAKLPHPGIPPVHALGVLPDGDPFLAMKLIRGQTFQVLLKSKDRSPASLLQIFEQIAQAVGFAHSKGIIHRDLKPANVMVGEFGEVQVMDWGLAKQSNDDDRLAATRSGAVEAPDATRDGTIMGTPAYMPPEQARGEQVDARADVFALGAILCEILTGKPPYTKGQSAQEVIVQAAAGDVEGAFQRLDQSGTDTELISIAKQCLNPHAEGRYPNGMTVAQAVAEYRNGVEERLRNAERERNAAEVRVGEQRKKRRVVMIAAGVIAVVLLVGIVGTTLGLLRARDETAQKEIARKNEFDRAEGERLATIEAEKQTRIALASAAAAKVSSEQTINNQRIILSIFKDFKSNELKEGTEPLEAILAKRLVTAAQQLDENAIGGDPLKVANLQNELGTTLLHLGYPNDAIVLFQKSLAILTKENAIEERNTLATLTNLAEGFKDIGQLKRAIPIYEDTLMKMRTKLGNDDEATLICMANLSMGYAFDWQLDKALPLCEENYKLMKAKYGADKVETLLSMGNLAMVLTLSGHFDRGIALSEETVKLKKAKLGPDNPDTIGSIFNLAVGYRLTRQFDRAVTLFEETVKLHKAKRGAEHPGTLKCMVGLANAYGDAGQIERKLPLLEDCFKIQKAKFGTNHPDTIDTMVSLFLTYFDLQRSREAFPIFTEYVEVRRNQDHANDSRFAGYLAVGSDAYLKASRFPEAEYYAKESLLIREVIAPKAWNTFSVKSMLGGAYVGQKKYTVAEPLLMEGYEGMKAAEMTIPPQYRGHLPDSVERLIELYTKLDKPTEVAKWRSERAKYPPEAAPKPRAGK